MASLFTNRPSDVSKRPKISLFTVFFLLVKMDLPGQSNQRLHIKNLCMLVLLVFSCWEKQGEGLCFLWKGILFAF
ncbi:MAG: hypothetical protein KAW45_08225, partial [Thermoplasmatales archaeon]|nr:hypothetical protein [Thermoplasmatales archaeon]